MIHLLRELEDLTATIDVETYQRSQKLINAMKKCADELLDRANRIQALAENPHWSADRRWRIGELAGEQMSLIRPAKGGVK